MSDFITEEGGYTWEQAYKRTWEETEDDPSHTLLDKVKNRELNRLRSRLRTETPELQRGMMRHFYIVIDLSSAMDDTDLRPTRLLCVSEILASFISEFFDLNPISQIGIIGTQNGTAFFISELSGNYKNHIQVLREKLPAMSTAAPPSLQNSLILSKHSLRNVPSHTSREVLMIIGSLTSCDPSNIFSTIKEVKEAEITCSVVGLGAHMKICQTIADATHGRYDVILHEHHFKEVLQFYLSPPCISSKATPALLALGFPRRISSEKSYLCTCHGLVTREGYTCPTCASKYCDVPYECAICGLTLVSSSHLARSYHHLFPVPPFEDYKEELCLNKRYDALPVKVAQCYLMPTCQPVSSLKHYF
ncbi:general transcription factor IIH subunit 2-like protein [Zophobas morio]|uniref:general transcription factor IIH subunit 2-like protein n=1 Tax=Zophobas morio TaxID=2755281 RepID=UPI003083DB47